MGGIAGSDDSRKQNHCEVEKRRRDKLNQNIAELASVIPAFSQNQSRLDKLTVLKMAVQHVKSLRSSMCSFSSFHLRPSFLSSGNLLKNLILQMASQEAQDNLFMVITCDRGKVLFVSKSSKDILNKGQSELVGTSLFEILHKDDVAKVREQISYFNLMPKELLVDSKTLQPIKSNQRESFIQLQTQSTSNTLQPGSKRSFFCRMAVERGINGVDSCVKEPPRRESSMSTKGNSNDENGPSGSGIAGTGGGSSSSSSSSPSLSSANGGHTGGVSNRKQRRYVMMHCSGYLKAITLRNDEYDDDDFDERIGGDSDDDSDDDQNKEDGNYRTVNCLVAVCRRSVLDRDLKPDQPLTFTCRYSMEGKFTFVDQRTTLALGYTPQQLMGTSHYAYCHKDSVNIFKECHLQCILKPDTVFSDIYQFKRANGQHMWLQTSLKSFRNPWTKCIEYIIANHTTAEGSDPKYNKACVPTKFNQDVTCEANSRSPLPMSSPSVPSEECNKSNSPSSSSIGSSYSIDSFASSGSIQALLDKIERVKPGGLKHPLKILKKRSGSGHKHHNHHIHKHTHHSHHDPRGITAGSSGGSSIRNSTNDSGNYPDIQSSLSSQNSHSLESSGRPTRRVEFVNQVSNVSHAKSQTSKTTTTATVATRTSGRQVRQQQEHRSRVEQQAKPPVQLVAETTDDSGAVACVDSANYHQFGSEEQDQTIINAGFGPDVPDNCEQQQQQQQQQNFEHQQTVCQQGVDCPPAPLLVCAQSNYAPSGANLVSSNPTSGTEGPGQQYVDAGSVGAGGPRMVAARVNRLTSVGPATRPIKPSQRPYPHTYGRSHQIKSRQAPSETVTTTGVVRSWHNQADASGGGCGKEQATRRRQQQQQQLTANNVNQPSQGMQSQSIAGQFNTRMAYIDQAAAVDGRYTSTVDVSLCQPMGQVLDESMAPMSMGGQQQQQMTSANVIHHPQGMQGQSNTGQFNTRMVSQGTFAQQPVDPAYINQAATIDTGYTTTADVSLGHPMSQVQDESFAPISMGGQQQMTSVNVIQPSQDMQSQPDTGQFNTHMPSQSTFVQQPVDTPYINQEATIDTGYTTTADVSLCHPMSQAQDEFLVPISLGCQQQQQTNKLGLQQSDAMGVPQIWNSSGGRGNETYSNMMATSIHTHGQPQIGGCHPVPAGPVRGGRGLMTGMVDGLGSHTGQHSQCNLCASHKCCAMNQPNNMMAGNIGGCSGGGDYNDMYLSSLAVDEFDESELVECLSACNPDSQMYNMESNYNTYPQQQQQQQQQQYHNVYPCY